MKRFSEFITESINEYDEERIEEVVNNCSEYLEFIGDPMDFVMYRGMRGRNYIDYHTIRKDRRPKDTPRPLHDKVDKFFEERYGVRLRSQSVQCTTDRSQASAYGDVYYVIPQNGYKVFYNEDVEDFQVWLSEQIWAKIEDVKDNPEEYDDDLPRRDDGRLDYDEIASWEIDPPEWFLEDILIDVEFDNGDELQDILPTPPDSERGVEIMLIGKGYYTIPVNNIQVLERIKEVAKDRGII